MHKTVGGMIYILPFCDGVMLLPTHYRQPLPHLQDPSPSLCWSRRAAGPAPHLCKQRPVLVDAMTAPATMRCTVVAWFCAMCVRAAHGWSIVTITSNASPAFQATRTALCQMPGHTCHALDVPSNRPFNTFHVVNGEYDAIIAEVGQSLLV